MILNRSTLAAPEASGDEAGHLAEPLGDKRDNLTEISVKNFSEMQKPLNGPAGASSIVSTTTKEGHLSAI